MSTPLDLALETGRSQRRVRAVLRELFGTLPEGASRWELSEQDADLLRRRLGTRGPDLDWSLEVGDTVRRRAIHSAYGGQRQGGISTPTSLPDILIFTDPKSGAEHGYDRFEGWREDGAYWYTGEGQSGDQKFLRGNAAIRDSAGNGKAIRLFTTNGTLATYVGSFTTGDPTYRLETIPDSTDTLRTGIIFNLVPVDADESLLPAFGGGSSFDAPSSSPWTPPAFSDVVISAEDRQPLEERVVSRAEFALQADFGSWLMSRGDEVRRLQLPIGRSSIEPDLYVPGRSWIVEAKKSTGRSYVRTAIGQVLDYVHIASRQGLPAIPVILLPSAPEADLVDLMHRVQIIVAFRAGDEFELLEP